MVISDLESSDQLVLTTASLEALQSAQQRKIMVGSLCRAGLFSVL